MIAFLHTAMAAALIRRPRNIEPPKLRPVYRGERCDDETETG